MSQRQVWDGLAERYDRTVRIFDTSYDRVRERIATDVPEDGRVLEVAAGTGQFTLDLARQASTLIATDFSPEMVARLSKQVDVAANIECATMSAYELDVGDASFDAVFCANGLHVMDQPDRALAEFRRVLAPNGVLIISTFLHGTGVLRRRLSQFLSLISSFVAHTRFDLATLEASIVAAGFEVIDSEQMPGLFPIGYVLARKRD